MSFSMGMSSSTSSGRGLFLLFGFVPAIDEDEEEDGAALAATGFVALSEDCGVGGLAVEPSAAEAGFVCFTSMATACYRFSIFKVRSSKLKFVLTWTLVGAIVVIQESRVILDDFINYSFICDQTRPDQTRTLAGVGGRTGFGGCSCRRWSAASASSAQLVKPVKLAGEPPPLVTWVEVCCGEKCCCSGVSPSLPSPMAASTVVTDCVCGGSSGELGWQTLRQEMARSSPDPGSRPGR